MVALKLGVPIDACLATQKDTFRKPSSGMWEVIHYSSNVDRHCKALLVGERGA